MKKEYNENDGNGVFLGFDSRERVSLLLRHGIVMKL